MISRDRWVVRIALIGVTISGIFSTLYFVFYTDINLIHLPDFQTYRTSAIYALESKKFIGTGPNYVYLPITLIFYLPLAFLPVSVAYTSLFVVNVIGGILIYIEVMKIFDIHYIEIRITDKILIFGSILLSPTLIGNLFNGQPNYWLVVFILLGYRHIILGNDYIGGAVFALPAIIKLWPAFLGLWLIYRRSYKGVLSAILTGVSAIAGSVVIFGYETNVDYFKYIIYSRSWTSRFSEGLDPSAGLVSIRRAISMTFPTMQPESMMLVGFLILSPIIYLYYRSIDSTVGDLAVLEATIIVVLLSLPSIYPYYILVFVPALPLVYMAESYILSTMASICLFLSVFTINASKFTSISDSLLPELVSNPLNSIAYPVLSYITPPAIGSIGLLLIIYLIYMNGREFVNS